MNPKFFQLPEEKQQHIINAAYKVFAGNSYKKAPMSEIADECGISKALLFHYFENKKELYLFLWKQAEELTGNAVREFGVMDTADFFEPAGKMFIDESVSLYWRLLFKRLL